VDSIVPLGLPNRIRKADLTTPARREHASTGKES
jgi:hypothetical protein